MRYTKPVEFLAALGKAVAKQGPVEEDQYCTESNRASMGPSLHQKSTTLKTETTLGKAVLSKQYHEKPIHVQRCGEIQAFRPVVAMLHN